MSARPPAPPAAEVAGLAVDLRLALGRITRRLRSTGAPDVTPSQLSVLANLEEHGPQRLRDLAGHEGVSAPTVSKVVDVLAERGLVVRSADPDDQRGTRTSLTAQGREFMRAERTRRNALLTESLARLAPADLARISAAVPALRLLLDQLCPTPHPEEP